APGGAVPGRDDLRYGRGGGRCSHPGAGAGTAAAAGGLSGKERARARSRSRSCRPRGSALEHAPGAGVLPGGVVLGQRHDLHAARGVGCLHDQVVAQVQRDVPDRVTARLGREEHQVPATQVLTVDRGEAGVVHLVPGVAAQGDAVVVEQGEGVTGAVEAPGAHAGPQVAQPQEPLPGAITSSTLGVGASSPGARTTTSLAGRYCGREPGTATFTAPSVRPSTGRIVSKETSIPGSSPEGVPLRRERSAVTVAVE